MSLTMRCLYFALTLRKLSHLRATYSSDYKLTGLLLISISVISNNGWQQPAQSESAIYNGAHGITISHL